MPWELYCHGLVTAADSSNNIVRLRETDPEKLLKWVDKPTERWRVYTDFCKSDSINNLASEHCYIVVTLLHCYT